MKKKIILATLVTLAIFSAFRCGGEKVTLPDEMIGEWKTSTPKYEGCHFELTKLTIAFKPKDEEIYSNIITKVKKEEDPEEERTLYTVFYKDEDGMVYQFPLYYYPKDNGIIIFKNQQEIVWIKKRSY